MKPNYWLLLILLVSLGVQAQTVLVIESYHAEHPWDISYKKGLKEALGPRYNFVSFQMDTKRIPQAEIQTKADDAWQLYLNLKPDLVVLGDDNALKYLGQKFLQTTTPVVYLGINANPRDYGVVGAPHIAGVLERPMLKRSAVVLREILPIKKILILLEATESTKMMLVDTFDGKSQHELEGITLDVKRVKSFRQWQQAVLAAKEQGYDALIVGLYHALTDERGQHVPENKVIDWTYKHTQVPPFGYWEFSIGANRNIGGYVLFGYDQGRLAGEIGYRLLNGEPVHFLPRTGTEARFMFSRSQLEKWQLQLPEHIAEKAILVD